MWLKCFVMMFFCSIWANTSFSSSLSDSYMVSPLINYSFLVRLRLIVYSFGWSLVLDEFFAAASGLPELSCITVSFTCFALR